MAAIARVAPREAVLAVRVCVARPPAGFGEQLAVMQAWLDATCGAAGWGSAPAGIGGARNDAIVFYFPDAAAARGFVDRFCCGYRAWPGVP